MVTAREHRIFLYELWWQTWLDRENEDAIREQLVAERLGYAFQDDAHAVMEQLIAEKLGYA